jgi:hypothetical protein
MVVHGKNRPVLGAGKKGPWTPNGALEWKIIYWGIFRGIFSKPLDGFTD